MKMKKYKLKKNIKNFLVFYSIICMMFFVSYTFSRYIDTTEIDYGVDIAKFNVSVNDVSVTDGDSFELLLSPNANTHNDKIAPNSEGYFEIVINPNMTEVSLEYEFLFDLSKLDSDLKLTECILNDKDKLEFQDNLIKGDLLLPSTELGFTEEDKLNIKIYWKWVEEEDIINPTIDNTNIMVSSIVRQKLD